MNVRQIHSLGEVLPEQAVRVFIGATLPGTHFASGENLGYTR